MYVSVEIILSGLPFQSTENISYGYEDSELNGVDGGIFFPHILIIKHTNKQSKSVKENLDILI